MGERIRVLHRIFASVILFAVALFFLSAQDAQAQTGQIAGQVTDMETGETLPGATILIEGTQRGTTTDPEGRYRLINVAPGTHTLQVSFVGYETTRVEEVEVNIDLTTEVNVQLTPETAELEGITVVAEERVIQEDLSASRVDIRARDIEALPVSNVDDVIGVQAGVQGLNIRGSAADQADLRIDGQSQGSARDNLPFTGVAYTSVEQVQVQSGGFNAEYGNMRSGVVNLITRSGPRDRYTADVILRYSPAASKHFGVAPNHPDAYWMRPYVDDEVAWDGTSSWPEELRRRYPDFEGFNVLAAAHDDLSPQDAQDLVMWRQRRDISIQDPDYNIDGSIGGPVPGIGQYLGNMRFMASYRQEQEQYIIPYSLSGYDEQIGRIKLTSEPASNVTLSVEGMRAFQQGQNDEWPRTGVTRIARDGDRGHVSNFGSGINYSPGADAIWGTGALSESQITRSMVGGQLNHMLTENTFYDVYLSWRHTKYRTTPPRACDDTPIARFGQRNVNEAPLCFSFVSQDAIHGLRMGAHHAEFRDTSDTHEWRARASITSQLDQYNIAKAGIELNVAHHDMDYEWDDFLLNPQNDFVRYTGTPVYGAAYVQNTLEYLGMIANFGVRLDYFDPNTDFYVFDDYEAAFLGSNMPFFDEMVETERASAQFEISPRLGVSFPITEASKLYFNYGHFYQEIVPEHMYQVRRWFITNDVVQIANPEMLRPRTISYEVGYEQSLFGQYLIRIAGYYKDLQRQPRMVNYISRDGLINYTIPRGENYQDVRGVEFSIFKNVGDWVRGFVNYTYQVGSGGNFGFGTFYESAAAQRTHERTTTEHYQSKPVPQPYARASLEFLTPADFGPEVGGYNVLGNWRLNFLAQWQAGGFFTYTGEVTAPEIQNNMQWTDYRMIDLRIAKDFGLEGMRAQVYADINNVFNIRNFNQGSFYGPRDWERYMESLHLPEEAVEGWIDGYTNFDDAGNPIFGDDRPGDLDGDHIEPPNGTSFHYLFPRSVFFGMRFSF